MGDHQLNGFTVFGIGSPARLKAVIRVALTLARISAWWHGLWRGHQIGTYVNLDNRISEVWCLDCHRHFFQKPSASK